ncbi:MAG: hypothetical protein K0Q59_4224 [Paenibacillus sp.]|nr:hypothetical protein [Paenibacillus sp.]
MWTVIAFLSGSLMFSYWLGLAASHNLQEYGDGNPGAINLWRAAGYGYGLAGIGLDFLKGYVPVVWLLHTDSATSSAIILASSAVLLGHMFSPFLGWRGGKAIAVTFGVWSALTGFAASLAYAVILAILLVVARWQSKGKPTSSAVDGFYVVLGMLLLAIFLWAAGYSYHILLFWLINWLLLAYAHRKELSRFMKATMAARS